MAPMADHDTIHFSPKQMALPAYMQDITREYVGEYLATLIHSQESLRA